MGWFSDEASQRSGGLASTTGILGGLGLFRPQVQRPVKFVHLPQLRPVHHAQPSHNATSFELKRAKVPVDVPSNAQRLAQHVTRELQFATGVVTLVVKKQAEQTWQNVASIAQLRQARREEQRVQTENHAPLQSATSLLLRAEALQTSGDLKGAIELLESANAIEPSNAGVLCFLSKQWTDHSFLPGITNDQIIQVNDRAIMHAMAAQKADPTLSLAYCAESICKGRKAFFESGPKKKLQLAKEAQEAAYRAVDLNHADDIAHHLIGRWNVGMAGLNFFVKACIKYVFGTDFRPGTMEDALLCYEKAAALRPDRVIHRVELARCYEHFGRREEAVAELQACLHLPLEDINARQMLEEGVQILHSFDPSYVPAGRAPVYINTSADALRTVWPDFSSALDDEALMTCVASPQILSAPVACTA